MSPSITNKSQLKKKKQKQKQKKNRSPKLKMLRLLRNQSVNLKTDARTLHHSLKKIKI